jgi:hypothetical protein
MAFVAVGAPSASAFLSASRARSTFVCGPRGAAVAPARVSRARAPVAMSLIPFVPNWLAMGAWLYGSYRFYGGFAETSYQQSYKVPLALCWPLFIAVNGKYRSNFMKALKAPKD